MAAWAFHWNELITRDPVGAKAFHGATVGWQFEGTPIEGGTNWVCKTANGRWLASWA